MLWVTIIGYLYPDGRICEGFLGEIMFELNYSGWLRINQSKQSRELIGRRMMKKQSRERVYCWEQFDIKKSHLCSETKTRSVWLERGGELWSNMRLFFLKTSKDILVAIIKEIYWFSKQKNPEVDDSSQNIIGVLYSSWVSLALISPVCWLEYPKVVKWLQQLQPSHLPSIPPRREKKLLQKS